VSSKFLAATDLGGEAVRDALAAQCVAIHTSVSAASERFYAELRRRYYTTPKSYLDLINLYLQVGPAARSALEGHGLRDKVDVRVGRHDCLLTPRVRLRLPCPQPPTCQTLSVPTPFPPNQPRRLPASLPRPAQLLGTKREELANAQDRLRNGLGKLNETNSMVDRMKAELASLQPVLESKAKATAELLVKVGAQRCLHVPA
jgi:hypothetical protein